MKEDVTKTELGKEVSFELNIKVEYDDGKSVNSGVNLDYIKNVEDDKDDYHKHAASLGRKMETLPTNSGVRKAKVKRRRLKRKKEITR